MRLGALECSVGCWDAPERLRGCRMGPGLGGLLGRSEGFWALWNAQWAGGMLRSVSKVVGGVLGALGGLLGCSEGFGDALGSTMELWTVWRLQATSGAVR
ncbi:hypothetical protein PGT21_005114 [Puccinia graminis f. sp. tritici]|uniref:Uncharacterized protein n=1 Tax=Puccinia graminis f. sp. tritici TaxID=56615 RepID=A0A5B0RCA2_PUCGR|nr:hypothetical protein PGT21_005114 [Puccinia graminis f. sp. tritici]KAA1123307.1 hypothetical protein PGTUg99_001819 [Puccinia graminis f. sp. tritici]